MSAPLVPSPLDYIGRRPFAFYPPISHPDPNEWLLGGGSHSEVQVVNAHTGHEIWVSRQYIGAVSETSSSLLIVGLTKALRFSEGTLEPKVKQVIEMPPPEKLRKEWISPALHPHASPGSVVEIRLETRSESTFEKAMILTCIGVIVIALVAALIAATIQF